MKTNRYTQSHLELIKTYEKSLEEHIAYLRQGASGDIEIAKKSAAESIDSYISTWEGYYKEFHPEEWQAKLEEERQKVQGELQDKICKIDQKLEEQIQGAYEAHKKAIQEQEEFQESLLDIQINSQISLAGGKKTFLSQIDSWGHFHRSTEAYIEKQLGDYAKEIGNWKDLRVVTEYVLQNCQKELESIFIEKLLTDEEEATAFTHLKKYGYRFMTEYGPLFF